MIYYLQIDICKKIKIMRNKRQKLLKLKIEQVVS